MSSSDLTNKINKKSFSFSYAIAFVVAMFALSAFFGGYKYFENDQNLYGLLNLVLSSVIFICSLAYMSFRIYAEEKDRDNLRTRIHFFEWLYSLRGRFRG